MGTLVLATGMTSCNEDNHFEYEISNECIVTSMNMGALKREMHTKNSKGEDSTFIVTVTGALYPLSIDQERQRIYNVDSLPVGTDISKMVFSSINTIGTYSIRSLRTGNDTIFNLNDSTDFSKPRILTVHATDGVSKRDYQIKINVHQEEGDSMVWHQIGESTPEIALLENTRSIAVKDQIFLFGEKDGATQTLCVNVDDYSGNGTPKWYTATASTSIRPQSVVRFHDQFYGVNAEDRLFASTDGTEWTALATDFTATTLVLSSSRQLVALKDGQFYSSTDGIAWEMDAADEPAYLPQQIATGTYVTSNIDKNMETWIVVGNNDGKNVVWKREIDLTHHEVYPWILLPDTPGSSYNVPDYQHVTLTTYDGVTMMAGLTAEGKVAPLLLSRDNGRTWKTNGIVTPEAQAQQTLAVNVDHKHFVWMFCGQTGEVWRGRINRLGWDEIEGSF